MVNAACRPKATTRLVGVLTLSAVLLLIPVHITEATDSYFSRVTTTTTTVV